MPQKGFQGFVCLFQTTHIGEPAFKEGCRCHDHYRGVNQPRHSHGKDNINNLKMEELPQTDIILYPDPALKSGLNGGKWHAA